MSDGLKIALAAALAAAGLQAAQAQGSRVGVQQLTLPRGVSAAVARPEAARLPQVRGTRGSSATTREGGPQPAIPLTQQMIDICRDAQSGGVAPEGVDCGAVLRAMAQAVAETTAEGSLLTILGQNRTVTVANTQQGGLVDADAVARQLSTGDIQDTSSMGAAGVVLRQQSAPPPTAPPR